MPFVSYAQNLEDVMLRRALGGVPQGFYIDVGAGNPHADSVTKGFYLSGWRGINIEPVKAVFDTLASARDRDVNLNIALDASSGIARFFSIDNGSGLSTLDSVVAAEHAEDGHEVEDLVVSTDTLAAVCRDHVRGPIHFLKIDVEGAEARVLEGADFEAFRPWVILIESAGRGKYPGSRDTWDDLLEDARYSFVYYDGLNRFYVSEERHAQLADAFSVPPNYFDDYVTATEIAAFEERAEISALLGVPASTHTPELIERLRVLLADRVLFEHLARSRQVEIDSLWQSSFEDSRQIAALSRELNNSRHNASTEIASLRSAAEAAQMRLQSLDARTGAHAEALQSAYDDALARIAELHESTSWRATQPLRLISGRARRTKAQ